MTAMLAQSPLTRLAWRFTHLLEGEFTRNKAQFAHHRYPILAPLPSSGARTRPLQDSNCEGPFLYAVMNGSGDVCYIGKSEERNVLARWIRPGNGGPAKHYWTHSTKGGGCVFRIADGLREGEVFELRYVTLRELVDQGVIRPGASVGDAEQQLIAAMSPRWNMN